MTVDQGTFLGLKRRSLFVELFVVFCLFAVSVVFLFWFIVFCFCVSFFAGVKVQPENKRQV